MFYPISLHSSLLKLSEYEVKCVLSFLWSQIAKGYPTITKNVLIMMGKNGKQYLVCIFPFIWLCVLLKVKHKTSHNYGCVNTCIK